MRWVVGAAIVIVALGGWNLVAWLSARHSVIPADATFGTVVPQRPSDSPLASHPALYAPAGAPSGFGHDPLRFLSTAPADSLELLPGVGPVLANRLLDARRNVGPFRSWDDVDRVRGIGPKTIERLKALAIAR